MHSENQIPCGQISLEARILRMVAHMDDLSFDRPVAPTVGGVCRLCGTRLPFAFIVTHPSEADDARPIVQMIETGSADAERLAALGLDGWHRIMEQTGAIVLSVHACTCMTGQVRDLAHQRIQDRIRARIAAAAQPPTAAERAGASAAESVRAAVRQAKSAPFGRHALSAGVEQF